ncbi:MAG: YceI family protein [Pseudomonadota bacterium]
MPSFLTSVASAFTISVATLATMHASHAEPHQYELDPTHTTVFFTVDHIGYAKTLGVFGAVEGTFTYDMENQELSDVNVKIQASNVTTFHKARDGHVKNKDFLNAKIFPEISFTASSGDPKDEKSGTVTGNLNLIGETKPVTLNVKLNKAEKYPFGHQRFVLGLSMDTIIKRSEFGMDYAVLNGLVGDDVDVRIETEAMRVE